MPQAQASTRNLQIWKLGYYLLNSEHSAFSQDSELPGCRKENAKIEEDNAFGYLWEDCREGLELKLGSWCEAPAPSCGAKEIKQVKQGSDKYLQGWAPLQAKWLRVQSSFLPIPASYSQAALCSLWKIPKIHSVQTSFLLCLTIQPWSSEGP